MKGLPASFVHAMGRERLRDWAVNTLGPLLNRILDRHAKRSIAKRGAIWALRDDAHELLTDAVDETLDWLEER